MSQIEKTGFWVYTRSIYPEAYLDKAKIFMNGKSQAVRLPKKFRFDAEEIEVREHAMGVLLIDPKKRWNLLAEVMGSMGDDFFPNGREDDLKEDEREDL